ncbi:hypothetical protein GCM10010174_42770 [Kutzneria viridogrisea]
MREMAGALGSFGADVRAGMAERESELSRSVEDKTGFRPGFTGGESWSPTRDARARRADGR